MESSRVETILGSILAGADLGIEKPASRVEALLKGIYDEGGGGGGGGTPVVYRNTTEYWDSRTTEISEKDALYIYTDFDTDPQGLVPALKIGDGVHTVPTLRFIAAGSSSYITDEEVDSWNNKVTADVPSAEEENLVLTKH